MDGRVRIEDRGLECYHSGMSRDSTSKPMVVSCGVLIQSPRGWLLAHATHTRRWDIPKGKMEDGEVPIETALRETREEIGIDLAEARNRMVDLGKHPYLPSKDLHLFVLTVPVAFSLDKCRCTSLIATESGSIPETDDYRWISIDDARQYIGKGLASYLVARGLLLPDARNNCRARMS